MTSYDVPLRETLIQASSAFGATTETFTHIGPKGKRGLVRDIEVDITADMVGTTTVPEVDVGTASGDASYARYRLGSAAGTGYTAASTPKRASQEAWTGNPPLALTDYAGHMLMNIARIP